MIERLSTIEKNGYAVVPSVLGEGEVQSLISEVESISGSSSVAGVRGLVQKIPAIQSLAKSDKMMSLVRPILGNEARLVRSVLFNKSSEVNWKVTWHQDLSIAVVKKYEMEGYGPWSVKEGIPHVQPPEAVLNNMLTVRVHLDPADESNGTLCVSPASHRNYEGPLSSILCFLTKQKRIKR